VSEPGFPTSDEARRAGEGVDAGGRAEAASERSFVVGESGTLGFAVPMDRVARVVASDALPARHRRLSLPRLFDGAAGAANSRSAEVNVEGAANTFFELGEEARVRTLSDDALEPVPACLATTARRWAWAGFVRDGARWRVLVDVPSLVALASERGAS
jgi:hypothetical protein